MEPKLRVMHRALADPLRIHLFELLVPSARSASELAELVGVRANRLYHHLAQLEQAGLIEIAEYRPLPRGKVERVYAARRSEPPGDMATPAERAQFLTAMLEATRADIVAASQAQEAGEHRVIALQRVTVRLDERRLEELRELIDRFIARAQEHPKMNGVWTTLLWTAVDRENRGRPEGADGLEARTGRG